MPVGAAALALIAATPIMILAAIAIKLDSLGPILFKQVRAGPVDALQHLQVPDDDS
ncbi:MAG: sugar transferase [Planctomycetaceae bacterium]|nr:sugar transferase [Planctomycetaceae bacterium]